MTVTITDIIVRDVRFPTSASKAGSDAMNPDPDYSASYVVLKTDGELRGHGLTFTNGRGNELCVSAIEALNTHALGRKLESIVEEFGRFWNDVSSYNRLRWMGA